MFNKLRKIIEYGLYILVFLLPWQTKLILRQTELGRGDWEYGTIALYGSDILLIGLLIIFCTFLFYKRKGICDNNGAIPESAVTHPVRLGRPPLSRGELIWIILSGLDLFVFISIFFAPDVTLAVYRYAVFLLGLGLFWLVVKAEYDRVKMLFAFFAGLLIQAVLAIGQFLLQGTFAFKWLGLAAHSPTDLGAAVVETFGAGGIPERWLRAYGSLDHPNVLGGLLAIGIIIFIYYFINKRLTLTHPVSANPPRLAGLGTPPKRGSGSTPLSRLGGDLERGIIFFLFSFLIFILGLIFTFSRSAWLGLAIGMVLFFIYYLVKKDRLALQRLGLVAALALCLTGIIFLNYQDLFITRTEATARLEVKSLTERQMYLNDSVGLIKKNWLFGVGIGNYTKILAVNDPHRPWYYLNPVHNVFLLVWSETGIFGILFFTALLIYLFIRCGRQKNILNLSLLSILVIIMMFDHYLWSLHFGILFFWILIGLIYKNSNKPYGES